MPRPHSIDATFTLAGCVTALTWVNRGPAEIVTGKGLMSCYTDANIIDGERIEGTIYATPESGFFGGGKPEIYFGPWDQKFMNEPDSKTTSGVQQDYKGSRSFSSAVPFLHVITRLKQVEFVRS